MLCIGIGLFVGIDRICLYSFFIGFACLLTLSGYLFWRVLFFFCLWKRRISNWFVLSRNISRDSTTTQNPQNGRLHEQVTEAEAVGNECPICAAPLQSGGDPCSTPCAHFFHKAYLPDWLGSGQSMCSTRQGLCRPQGLAVLSNAGFETMGSLWGAKTW